MASCASRSHEATCQFRPHKDKLKRYFSLSVDNRYNACVFAYGATGGGKTYTMVGTQDNPGCMVRALNDLFRAMDEAADALFKVGSPCNHQFLTV